jgi:hypothetical protein
MSIQAFTGEPAAKFLSLATVSAKSWRRRVPGSLVLSAIAF